MSELYLDGGGDPTFADIDDFLRTHFNAHAVYNDHLPFAARCAGCGRELVSEGWSRCPSCGSTLLERVAFPDADTERAVRRGASWPGSLEGDIAATPWHKAFEPTRPNPAVDEPKLYHGHGDPTYLLIAILVLAVWCAGLTFVIVR